MADEAGEKSFQPSARKLQRAREKGQIPQSQELGTVVTLMVLVLTLAMLAPWLMSCLCASIKSGLSARLDVFTSADSFTGYFKGVMIDTMIMAAPLLLALLVAGIVGSMAMGGVAFSPEALEIKWDALDPSKSIQSLFSMRSLVKLTLSIAKLVFVFLIVWFYLRNQIEALAALRWAWSMEILAGIARIVFGVCVRIGVALLAIALADILYQKWKYMDDMKMTHQEVRQEHKDMEGSPEIKARIRRIRIQMTMQRVRKEVPKADVILVNPTHYAVALKYDAKTMDAPMVVAKGTDHMADRIREIARAYGVPIIRRPELARTLYATVEPGKSVPTDLYMAIAEVLAMIYRLRQKKKR